LPNSAVEAEPETDSFEDNPNDDLIIYNGAQYSGENFFILTIVAHICSFLLPAVFYVILKGIDWSKNLKWTLPEMRLMPFSIYMFFVLMLGAVFINYLYFYLSGKTLDFPGIDTDGGIVFNLGVFVTFVCIPAVCEEFVFRSVMPSEYERYGAVFSMTITSAAFAMSKFSLQLFSVYFFASVIFFICARVTNSILVPISLHIGYNFFNIYIEGSLMNILKFEQNRFIFLFILFILFVVFICLSLSSLEEHYYRKAYRNDPFPVNVMENAGIAANISKTFLSPSFILVVIIFFVYVSFII
jgi:membrane protease YdiL (CAAX protease family)